MTHEDVKMLRENLKKIEEYCTECFISEMKHLGCNRISAGWEYEGQSNYSGESQYKYTFTVDKNDGLFFKIGNLVLQFGDNNIHTNIYHSAVYGKELILHWQNIKKQLEKNMAAARREKCFIAAFQV